VLFGEYGQYKGVGQDVNLMAELNPVGIYETAQISAFAGSDTKMTHWGVGVVQYVDAASMEFWVTYKNYSLSGFEFNSQSLGDIGGFEDLHLISAGTRIRF
jgi:hypothetical protein